MQQYSLSPSSLPITEMALTEVMGEDGGGADGASHLDTAAAKEGGGQVGGEQSGGGGAGSEVPCGGNGSDGNALWALSHAAD